MSHIDILIERLKGFEETQLIELLDLTSEEIVDRFRDLIYQRRDYLFGEIEMLTTDEFEDEPDLFRENYDGYQIEDYENE